MADFADVPAVDRSIISTIDALMDVRKSVVEFARTPTEDNASRLAEAIDRHTASVESMRSELIVVFQKARGTDDEVTGVESDQGIEFR